MTPDATGRIPPPSEWGDVSKPDILYQLRQGNLSDSELRRRLHGFFRDSPDAHEAFKAYAKQRFGKESTTELTRAELAQAYSELRTRQAQEELQVPERGARLEHVKADMAARYNVNSLDELPTVVKDNAVADAEMEHEFLNAKPGAAEARDIAAERKALIAGIASRTQARPLLARAGKGLRWLSEVELALRKLTRGMIKSTSGMPWLLSFLDSYQENGPFKRIFQPRIVEGWDKASTMSKQDADLVAKLAKERGVSFDGLDHKIALGKEGFVYTVGDAIRIYQIARDQQQRASLMESNLAIENDPSIISDAMKLVKANKNLMGVVGIIDDVKDAKWAALADIYKKVTGKTLGRIAKGKYATMQKVDGSYIARDPMDAVMTIGNPGYDPKLHPVPMTKQRGGGGKGSEVRLGNPYAELMDYCIEANNYIAKAEPVRHLLTVLESRDTVDPETGEVVPGVADAMRRAFGGDTSYWSQLRTFIQDEMYPAARSAPLSAVERGVQKMRTQAESSLIGFRFTSPIMTVVSIGTGLANIPGGMGTFTRSIEEGFKILKTIGINEGRSAKGAEHLLEGHEVYGLLKEYAPFIFETMRYAGDPTQSALRAYQATGVGKIKIGGRTILERSMAGMKTMNLWGAATVWYVAYKSVYESEMLKAHVNPMDVQGRKAIERKAADFATDIVTKTQGSSVAHEKNMLQRSHEGIRLLLSFTGDTMKTLQTFQHSMLRPLTMALDTGDWSQLRKGSIEGNSYDTGYFQKIVLGIVLPSLVWGFLQRRRMPDDREWALDILCYPIQSLPIFGPPLSGAIMYGMEPSMVPVGLTSVDTFAKVMADVAGDRVDLLHGTGRNILRFGAVTAGYPEILAQAVRITVQKSMEGEPLTGANIREVIGLRTAKPRRGSSQD